jgi:Na+-driven multidrug efflux pump
MVGTNVGAGHRARAERIAWTGAGMAAALTGIVGLSAAVFPDMWLGLFSTDPAVRQAGGMYLRVVGPAYGFFGLGLALYFASQGAGRLLWPVLAGFSRLAIAGVGGWLAIHWFGGGLIALFGLMALAFVVFGITLAWAVRFGAWRGATQRAGGI